MKAIEVTLPQPVLFVAWTLLQARFEAYIVGGAVRDILLDRETADWDVTTKAVPEMLLQLFEGGFYDNNFGTVMVPAEALFNQMKRAGWQSESFSEEKKMWQGQIFDITTFRVEHGYSDRRRPDIVEWGKTIEDDLSRRDFTINALALQMDFKTLKNLEAFIRKQSSLSLTISLIDLFQGYDDLQNGLVRAVGDPTLRFTEDALRMMRAIRLGAQLKFAIETKTLTAIQDTAPLIEKISWERIRDELLKILTSPYPADGIALLATSGLLTYIAPELLAMKGIKQGGHHIYDVWTHSLMALQTCPSTDTIVRLATLLHDIGKPKTLRYQGPRGVTFYGHEVVGARIARDIGKRLRLSNKEVDRLFTLVRWHMFAYDSAMTDAAIRRFIRRVGIDNINDMILLRVGDRKGGGSKATSWRLREFQQRIGEQLYEPLSVKDLKINGNDVMKILKIQPGPRVGKILDLLFEEVMEDSSKNTQEYLLKRTQELGQYS